MSKCIYCNSHDVSESDIIPVALTNTKITKKNVCTLKHNNVFGNTFESDVINKLSVLRDQLDIKGKGKKYPESLFDVKVGDSIFKRKLTKHAPIFSSRPMSSDDEKTKFGPIEIIEKIAESEKQKGKAIVEFKEIDVNNEEIEQQFKIDLTAFASRSAKRLIAKMAYEWFCYVYNIEEYLTDFDDIVNYICKDEWLGEELVNYVLTKELYTSIKQSTEHGSHTFLAYENDSSINILVSFFDICVYSVKLLDKPNLRFTRNCFVQEFQLVTKRKTLPQRSLKEFQQFIKESFVPTYIPGFGVYPYPREEIRDKYEWELIGLYQWFILNQDYIKMIDTENNELIEILIDNYTEVLNGNLLHIRNLKRFALEAINEVENIQLNPNAYGGEKILFYYLVFQIGKQMPSEVNDALIKEILSGMANTQNEIIFSRDLEQELLNEILREKDYAEILKKGREKILAVNL
ncbi:hypothetical protein V2H29_15005 [Lysinibacillus fusiformis]|uniref:hypothetical protein n=1 Tax=Lysinibacillus fusiformis TaxID=28031 RepID=UPI002E99A107|nr:hypothetical protein [Lysinibacillus fusiformis]